MHCLIRRTYVINDYANLPRPKRTSTVLKVGTLQDCKDLMEQLALSEMPSADVDVRFVIERYRDQKSSTSSRPGNGKRYNYEKRNNDSKSGDDSISDT